MKFIHLSDLHIGKRINGFSLIEDQEYILQEIIDIIDDCKPNAVVIAGDVYDKSIPSVEAVTLFNSFLQKLVDRELNIFIIAGNHDSVERLSFGYEIMKNSKVYISPIFNNEITPVILNDDYGEAAFYMLPFIKPANVRAFFEGEIISYNDAVKSVVSDIKINKNIRNIMITHQFVTGAVRCESEEISVGGSDNIDYHIFDEFDYVALGHIHSPQSIGRDCVRYCGTPLKYSFSEINNNNSVTVVNLNEKGNVQLEFVPLTAKRDMQEIKGKYEELVSKSFYENLNRDNYFRVILTDNEDVIDAIGKLRVIYPNIMSIKYDNERTSKSETLSYDETVKEKTPFELFCEFYEKQNNIKMNEQQEKFMLDLIEKEKENCDR